MKDMDERTEIIARYMQERQGRPVSVQDMASALGMSTGEVMKHMEMLLARDEFFDLGELGAMYSTDVNLAAFEIFRSQAPNITYEEFLRHREQPHILMRMSRDRDIEMGTDHQQRLRNAIREKNRGNSVF